MKKVQFSRRTQLLFVLGFIFLSMLLLNIFTPLLADDYSYSFGVDGRIHNLFDIIERQIQHYFSWGGRSVAHTIAQIFLMFPKFLFNISNAVLYTLVIYLMYFLAKPMKSDDHYLLILLIHFALWFLLPTFGQNCLWLIGSCNYLWTTALMLLMLSIYKRCSEREDSIFFILGMFLLGLLSGWTNENAAAGFLVIIIGVLFIKKYRDNKVLFSWEISGLIGSILGFIILILAPGNFKRAQVFAEHSNIVIRWLKRFLDITVNGMEYLFPLLILLIVMFTVMIYCKKKIRGEVILYLIGSFVSIYAMILSPTFPERAWFGVFIFSIIASLILLFDSFTIHRVYQFILIDFLLVVIFVFIRDYITTFQETKELYHVWENRITYIQKEKQKGKTDILVDSYYNTTGNKKVPNFGLVDILNKKNEWPNNYIAKYFEIHSIRSK